ncbi:MAG: HD domain-containing protein [Patescibacteria group bacterium]
MKYKEILKLHNIASSITGVPENIILDHSSIVKDFSVNIVKNKDIKNIDVDLLIDGALLHDIGAYFCLNKDYSIKIPYIMHGILGEQFLIDHKINLKIARFASHHTGVGILKDDIKRLQLPLPMKNFIPETIEEEIVCYADNFHSKRGTFSTFNDIKLELQTFGDDKIKKLNEFKNRYGIPTGIDLNN